MTDEELEKRSKAAQDKAITKATGSKVAIPSDNDFASQGPQQDVTANDVMIPKIIIMQPQSPRVVNQDNSLGDLVETLGFKTLANAKTSKKEASSILATPIFWSKYWVNKRHNSQTGKFEFESLIKMDSTNQSLDMWEEWKGEDGAMRKRQYMHLFHVLLPGSPIPYAIAFKGSSKKSGDALVTQMFTINKKIESNKAYLKSPMGNQVKITPVIVTKNNNTFVSLEMSVERPSTFEEACAALEWSKNIGKGQMEVDHSDLQSESIDAQGGSFHA